MKKPAYLGLLILELSKILRYEFWCDYVEPKSCEREKLCYMDTTFSLYTQNQIKFINTSQKMLKLNVIL